MRSIKKYKKQNKKQKNKTKQDKTKQNKTKENSNLRNKSTFFRTDYTWAAILFSSGETDDGGGKGEGNIL